MIQDSRELTRGVYGNSVSGGKPTSFEDGCQVEGNLGIIWRQRGRDSRVRMRLGVSASSDGCTYFRCWRARSGRAIGDMMYAEARSKIAKVRNEGVERNTGRQPETDLCEHQHSKAGGLLTPLR